DRSRPRRAHPPAARIPVWLARCDRGGPRSGGAAARRARQGPPILVARCGCAPVRFHRARTAARPAAEGRRQSSLQYLYTTALPPPGECERHQRHARHAAARGDCPHGRSARGVRLRTPYGHAVTMGGGDAIVRRRSWSLPATSAGVVSGCTPLSTADTRVLN